MARDTDRTAANGTNRKNLEPISSILYTKRPAVNVSARTYVPEDGEFVLMGGWGEAESAVPAGSAALFATQASRGVMLRPVFGERLRTDRDVLNKKRIEVLDGEMDVLLSLYNYKEGVNIVAGDLVMVRGNRQAIQGAPQDYRWIADIVSKDDAADIDGWQVGYVLVGASAATLVPAATGDAVKIKVKLFGTPIFYTKPA
jgi:hypothetical protein